MFHILGPATGKLLSPSRVHVRGTARTSVSAERSWRRPDWAIGWRQQCAQSETNSHKQFLVLTDELCALWLSLCAFLHVFSLLRPVRSFSRFFVLTFSIFSRLLSYRAICCLESSFAIWPNRTINVHYIHSLTHSRLSCVCPLGLLIKEWRRKRSFDKLVLHEKCNWQLGAVRQSVGPLCFSAFC